MRRRTADVAPTERERERERPARAACRARARQRRARAHARVSASLKSPNKAPRPRALDARARAARESHAADRREGRRSPAAPGGRRLSSGLIKRHARRATRRNLRSCPSPSALRSAVTVAVARAIRRRRLPLRPDPVGARTWHWLASSPFRVYRHQATASPPAVESATSAARLQVHRDPARAGGSGEVLRRADAARSSA